MKSAPFLNSDLAIADAAYEQLDDAMPYPDARAIAAGRCVPSFACIAAFETKAWTTPDSVKPSTSAQSVSQSMKRASRTTSTDIGEYDHVARAGRSRPHQTRDGGRGLGDLRVLLRTALL